MQKSIEQKGVKFILSNSVKEFKGNTAFLTNDDILNFDIVVVAVGVRPNVELVKEIGGDVNRGIITDERCHTSIPVFMPPVIAPKAMTSLSISIAS